MRIGCLLLALIVPIKLLAPIDPDNLSLIIAAVGITAMLASIPVVEKELQQKFGR
ncbi:MAG: hypothetical protein AB1767_00045 [Bacillota bacterium]